MHRSPFAVTAFALCVGALSAAGPAAGHGPDLGKGEGKLDARLGALPPELEGVAAQLRHTLGPQLVVENRTQRWLDVLDGDGVPFVRIGPAGVFANLESPAWYRTLAPETGAVPKRVAERARAGEPAEVRWGRVSQEPSWGWFDPRLEPSGAGHHGAKPTAGWSVPVRLGDTESALRGSFVPRRAPAGALRARLRSDAQLAPGVRVSLLPGRPGSFFLKSDGTPLQVLGRDGEPFLRFGASGVEANLRSPTYADVVRLRGVGGVGLEPGAEGGPRWQRVASLPSYGWVDPRTTPDEATVPQRTGPDGEPVELLEWRLPVRLGDAADAALVHIEGVTVWEPFRDS